MFFALTLTALIVSYSGLAFEQAQRQAEEYALRYSLERLANDAADVLLKTLGEPVDWEENAEYLETVGFAEENEGNPVPNTVSIKKFGQFRRLCNAENWVNPTNENAVNAIKKLFGGSEKFEVRILDENENELWRAYPRWDVENSGVENSLEVVIVRRLAAVRYGAAIKADTGTVTKAEGGLQENYLWFQIYPGELDAFDFYIYVVGEGEPNYVLHIFVNRDTGDYDYRFRTKIEGADGNETYPSWHGGVESDNDVDNNLQVGTNFLYFRFTGNWGWGKVSLVMMPTCSDWEDAAMFVQPLPATLEVKMWR
jgi:hypothetical protein